MVSRLVAQTGAFLGMGLSLALPASARAAPAALFGKSIVITWAESRMDRPNADQSFKPRGYSINLSVYISSAGRVFSRLRNFSGGSTDQVNGSGATVHIPARVPRFSDHSMTMFAPFQGGGSRRINVDFSSEFGTCKAKIIFAKDVGHETALAWNSASNRPVEIQSMSVSGENCIVQGGNVFANSQP